MSEIIRKSEDYNELLCEAIDTIVSARLANLPYNKSITCQIIDNSKRSTGEYTVSDGSVTFTAYSDNDKDYPIDTYVVVNIPNGDWNEKKHIIGRYTSDEEEGPYVYSDPIEQVANLSGHLQLLDITGATVPENKEFGIIANGADKAIDILQYQYIGTKKQEWQVEIYNTLAISAEFKTHLNYELITSGSYGLILEIETTEGGIIYLAMNSIDMFGNPYNYASWTRCSQAYKLNKSVGAIKSIKCSLAQSGNFQYLDNGEKTDFVVVDSPNILVRDIKIFLGPEVTTIDDNTARIVTTDNFMYKGELESEQNKQIFLIWYNKDKGNSFLSFSDGEFNKEKAMSNKYTDQDEDEIQRLIIELWTKQGNHGSPFDDDNKDNWPEEFEKAVTDSGYYIGGEKYPLSEDDKENNKIYYWIEWYQDDIYGELQAIDILPVEDNIITGPYVVTSVTCRPTLLETRASAKVWMNKQAYVSNTLTFKNQNALSTTVNNSDVTITINHGDNSQSAYALYGSDNMLITPSNEVRRRYLNISYNWKYGVIPLEFWKNYIIEWRIPLSNTMLAFPSTLKSTENGETPPNTVVKVIEKEDGKYCSYNFVYSQTNESCETEWKLSEPQFYYNLKRSYSPSFADNTIGCCLYQVDEEGKKITSTELNASISFSFSSIGNSGTEYTIVIAPKSGAKYAYTTWEDRTINNQKNGFEYPLISESSTITSQITVNKFNTSLVNPDGIVVDSAEFTTDLRDISTRKYDKDGEIEEAAGSGVYIFTASTIVEWATRKVKLEHVYPVQYSSGGRYSTNIPLTIVYDANGKLTNTAFDGIVPKLFIDDIEYDGTVEWDIQKVNSNGSASSSIYAPKIETNTKEITNESNEKVTITYFTFVVPQNYIKSNCNYYITAKIKRTTDSEFTPVWQAPIILTQYVYNSEILNNWTGETLVDDDNKRIFTSSFVAGNMDEENRFNGVVLGDVEDVVNMKTVRNTGLYGYKDGVQSYGFKDDGTAFIGAPGAGRIEFDGERGIIQSNGYKSTKDAEKDQTTPTGMKIDLLDGSIDAYNFKLTSDAIKLNSDGAGSSQIAGWNISKEGFFYQNENKTNYDIYLGSKPQTFDTRTNIIFKVGDNFFINNNGRVFATGGEIGGWTLTGSALIYKTYDGDSTNNKSDNWTTGKGAIICPQGHPTATKLGGLSFDKNTWIMGIRDKFGVTTEGTLHVKNAVISGDISANSLVLENKIALADVADYSFSRLTEEEIEKKVSFKLSYTYVGEAGDDVEIIGIIDDNADTQLTTDEFIFKFTNMSDEQVKKIVKLTIEKGRRVSNPIVINNVKAIDDDNIKNITASYKINASANGIAIGSNFFPSNSDYSLGSTNLRWSSIYTIDGSSKSSDENLKNITNLTSSHSKFFDTLNPIIYYWKNNPKQLHFGFGAQTVENGLIANGFEPKDYYLLHKGDTYSLTYSEFIALNTWQIQLLKKRVFDLEQKLSEIIGEKGVNA